MEKRREETRRDETRREEKRKRKKKKERERKRDRDLAHTASGQFALAWSFGSNAWGERTAGAIACASVVAFQGCWEKGVQREPCTCELWGEISLNMSLS